MGIKRIHQLNGFIKSHQRHVDHYRSILRSSAGWEFWELDHAEEQVEYYSGMIDKYREEIARLQMECPEMSEM